MSEVYNSSTLGPIPLSFTGRRLMQNLREEFQTLIKKVYENGFRDGENGQRRFPHHGADWAPVSRARGELAKYISKREGHLQSGADSVPYEDDRNPHPYGKPTTPRVIVLPQIPEGYELHIIGDVVSISPIEKHERDPRA